MAGMLQGWKERRHTVPKKDRKPNKQRRSAWSHLERVVEQNGRANKRTSGLYILDDPTGPVTHSSSTASRLDSWSNFCSSWEVEVEVGGLGRGATSMATRGPASCSGSFLTDNSSCGDGHDKILGQIKFSELSVLSPPKYKLSVQQKQKNAQATWLSYTLCSQINMDYMDFFDYYHFIHKAHLSNKQERRFCSA